jgi:hypothetical protein
MRMSRLLLLALLPIPGLAACTDEQPFAPDLPQEARLMADPGSAGVVVMSRNIFLGAEIMSILEVPFDQVPIAAAMAWQEVVATDFPARAELLADEIAAAGPHLVGLNEVSLYRVQTTSDMLAFVSGAPTWIGPPVPNASVEAYDFIEILLAALEARGLDYRIAAQVTDHDLEVPAFAGMGAEGPLFMDIRYTDHDVILARSDVDTENAYAQVYTAFLPVPMGPLTLPLLRGWAAVEATVGMREFLFVATHLEVQEYPTVQAAQLAELMAWMDLYEGTTVLVGDLNSAANPSAPERARTATYPTLLAAGFHDTWLRTHDANDGVTCCQAASLMNAESLLTERLDLVLVRQPDGNLRGGYQTTVIGDDPSVRTASGLWASDHAGLVTILRMPPSFALN